MGWQLTEIQFNDHINKAINQANQILGLIRRSFTYMDIQSMKQLFTALVRPHLEYGNVIWHPHLKRDIDSIERVQHRATRMVQGMANLPHEERLKTMKLPSLVYRRLRGDSIELYKYKHNIYKTDSDALLPAWKSEGLATRGHQLRLLKRHCKSRTRSNFFSYRMVNIWNRLPEKVVLSSSVNCFQGRFDSFFWDNWYETDLEQILSNAFATKFDNFKDFDEEYLEEDTFPDRSTGIWPIATEYDDDDVSMNFYRRARWVLLEEQSFLKSKKLASWREWCNC